MSLTEQEIVTVEGVLRVCCSLPENLIAQPQASDLVVKTCRVCDRNHYELGVAPIELGLELHG